MNASRTYDEIQVAIDAFESQFEMPFVEPGTPNRKHLQRAAHDAAFARSILPENISARQVLHAERAAAQRSATAKKAAARVAARPCHAERQRVFRALRSMGFKREHTSGQSAYYRRGDLAVRVSDHEVPATLYRQANAANGRQTWAGSGLSIVLGEEDSAEWLKYVAEIIQDEDRERWIIGESHV